VSKRTSAVGARSNSVPYATLALALVGALFFLVLQPRDRPVEAAAAAFYVDSGLAGIELPRYRDYLQRSQDADAVRRLTQLERATGRAPAHPVDPLAVLRVLQADAVFEHQLRAGKIVEASDPVFADWQRDRQRFDDLSSRILAARLNLNEQTWNEPWRLLTYSLLHAGPVAWLADLLFLLILGPVAEAVAGASLLLGAFCAGSAITGAIHLLLIGTTKTGDWGALAAIAGLLTTAFGTHRIKWSILGTGRRVAVPAYAAVLLLAGFEALRWGWLSFGAVDLPADVAGLAVGALLAWGFRLRDGRRVQRLEAGSAPASTGWPRESSLVLQAREAATRLDTRRAAQLYKEVVDLEPQRIEHLCAYLNVALLGPDETNLQDAALRLLWLRSKSQSEELRKAFVLMTQPKVLAVLPIDEHLRLSRRLVRIREDAAALRVLDAILSDEHLRQLYGRQLADCLLGIYTGYVRRRLTTLADTIRSRLVKYFEAPDQIGGMPPATRPPTTLFTASPNPSRIGRDTRS
jgi:membrane associated rhomboid family serine protease